jgi:hypothetical protein
MTAPYLTIAQAQAKANEAGTPCSIRSLLEAVRIDYPEYRQMSDERLWQRLQLAFQRAEDSAAGSGPDEQRQAAVHSDVDLRRIWRSAGGSFHGSRIEHGTMQEVLLLPFLRRLLDSVSRKAA